jgi:uncharacterized small protein (DUF1192 family)
MSADWRAIIVNEFGEKCADFDPDCPTCKIWAGIADLEAERDAANARAKRYKAERDGQARKISDVQGLLTASEEAEARIANQRAEINRLQAQLTTARAEGYADGVRNVLAILPPDNGQGGDA